LCARLCNNITWTRDGRRELTRRNMLHPPTTSLWFAVTAATGSSRHAAHRSRVADLRHASTRIHVGCCTAPASVPSRRGGGYCGFVNTIFLPFCCIPRTLRACLSGLPTCLRMNTTAVRTRHACAPFMPVSSTRAVVTTLCRALLRKCCGLRPLHSHLRHLRFAHDNT